MYAMLSVCLCISFRRRHFYVWNFAILFAFFSLCCFPTSTTMVFLIPFYRSVLSLILCKCVRTYESRRRMSVCIETWTLYYIDRATPSFYDRRNFLLCYCCVNLERIQNICRIFGVLIVYSTLCFFLCFPIRRFGRCCRHWPENKLQYPVFISPRNWK